MVPIYTPEWRETLLDLFFCPPWTPHNDTAKAPELLKQQPSALSRKPPCFPLRIQLSLVQNQTNSPDFLGSGLGAVCSTNPVSIPMHFPACYTDQIY